MKVPGSDFTSTRSGAVLLEVIVAMTIFAIASVTTIARAAQVRRVVFLAQGREDHLNAASEFLDRVVLWPRADLDRHLGTHPQGEWLLEVQHPAFPLYTIVILDGETHQKLLDTVVYRSVPRAASAY